MAKSLTIHGQRFEVIRPRTSNMELWEKIFFAEIGGSIYDAYDRPSQTKVNIYEFWRHWFHELYTDEKNVTFETFAGVTAHNGFQFTVMGIIEIGSKAYIAKITRDHNYLYEVVE